MVARKKRPAAPAAAKAPIGDRIREIRRSRGETLGDVARRTGLSPSTLSKIENDKISPTFANLMRITEGLGISLSDLVSARLAPASPTARMAVTRAHELVSTRTPSYELHPLCVDLRKKRMQPLINRVLTTDARTGDQMVRHGGEEFGYVLSGAMDLHTEHYAPVRLKAGDCFYLDSQMAHAFVSAGPEPARLLNVWLSPEPQDSEEVLSYAKSLFARPAR